MTQKRASAPATGKKASFKTGKNWVMAFDPYVDFDTTPMRQMAQRLAGNTGADVVATYVLAPASFNWSGDFSGPWMKRYKPAAEDKMEELFAKTSIHPVVIGCQKPGLREAVKTLNHFAQKVKAQGIVISSHARHGLGRWALGSFAETLILSSKTPVVIVNPDHPAPEMIRRILVPVDLITASGKYVALNAALAKSLGAEIILYYKQPDPLDPIIQQGVYTLGGGWVSVQNFIDEEVEMKRKRLDRLAQTVRAKGVPVSTILDTGEADLIAGINAAAAGHAVDMVSVWTHSSPLSAAVLGSVARGLVRSSSVPVLVRR